MLEVVFQFFYIPAVSRIFFSVVTAGVNPRLPKIESAFKSILGASLHVTYFLSSPVSLVGITNDLSGVQPHRELHNAI